MEYYCDICEKIAKNKCYLCGIDICNKHTVFDDRCSGDYPDKYCENCWNIGEKYRKKIQEIEDEAYEKIGQEDENWKEEAVAFSKRLSEKNNKSDSVDISTIFDGLKL